MNRRMPRHQALVVACPACGADMGKMCGMDLTVRGVVVGRVVVSPHPARRKAALAAKASRL